MHVSMHVCALCACERVYIVRVSRHACALCVHASKHVCTLCERACVYIVCVAACVCIVYIVCVYMCVHAHMHMWALLLGPQPVLTTLAGEEEEAC